MANSQYDTLSKNVIKLSTYSTSTYCGHRNLPRARDYVCRYRHTCFTGQARAAHSCCPQQVPDLTPWPNLGPWPRSLRGQPTLYKEGILSPRNHAIFTSLIYNNKQYYYKWRRVSIKTVLL